MDCFVDDSPGVRGSNATFYAIPVTTDATTVESLDTSRQTFTLSKMSETTIIWYKVQTAIAPDKMGSQYEMVWPKQTCTDSIVQWC